MNEEIYEEMGRNARRALESDHYKFLKNAPLEEIEKLFLPGDNPDTTVQVVLPLGKARTAFRRGWNDN